MDLPKLLIQRSGSCLCRCILLKVVHLQVPVYEVALSKTDHFHTRKTRLLSIEFSDTGWQMVAFILTCTYRSELLAYKDTSQAVALVPSLRVLLSKHTFL